MQRFIIITLCLLSSWSLTAFAKNAAYPTSGGDTIHSAPKIVGLLNQAECKAASIDSLLSLPFFDTTLCGIVVYDATTGTTIIKKNEKLLLRPASNLKILTSAAALLQDSPPLAFRTREYFDGKIRDGVLHGDIYIKGTGDPEFSLTDIDSLAVMIKEKGIRRITGHIYGDISFLDSLMLGAGWMWDDDPDADEPYLSALSVNKNAVRVSVSYDASEENTTVALSPDSKFFHISQEIQRGAGGNTEFEITRDFIPRTNTIIIKGRAGNNDTTVTRWLNVYNPGMLFLNCLYEKLRTYHISVRKQLYFRDTPENATLIGEISRLVSDVLMPLNKKSDNLNAEMVLRSLGHLARESHVSAKDGIKYIDTLIRRANFLPENYNIVDASGISYYNLLSPELLCGVLQALHEKSPSLFEKLISTFPVSGTDGTLKNRMTDDDVKGKVRAKTGTLNSASCLSGCASGADGHLYIFSIMMQNFKGKLHRVRHLQDEICRILVR